MARPDDGKVVRVTAPSRLHITLLDVGNATQRLYGGVGMPISSPRVVVVARAASRRHVIGLPEEYERAAEATVSALETMLETPLRGEVSVAAAPDPHVGLGSKTAVLLSVGRAIAALNGCSVTAEQLWRASGRGGTSGIGVHAFFGGGLLVDGGHPAPATRTFAPSSRSRPVRVPPLLASVAVPASWRITLVLPQGHRVSGDEERDVFGRAPVPDAEILRVLAAVYHGLLAAVATDDLDAAARALTLIMSTGFKRLEVANQPEAVRLLARDLADATRRPVGMSSMGPLLYVLHRTDDGTPAVVARCAGKWRAAVLCTTTPAPRGHVVEYFHVAEISGMPA
ncbi:MAG TPA: beta-ribofuranosylaminobenzene 5'-phosphate synthase family protein [Streptosporangiaceae bacterium]